MLARNTCSLMYPLPKSSISLTSAPVSSLLQTRIPPTPAIVRSIELHKHAISNLFYRDKGYTERD